MFDFKVTFHRYGTDGNRITRPTLIPAEDFHKAMAIADAMLLGMRSADHSRKYIIASVETDGLRGEVCDGAYLWETAAELSERVAEK